MRSYMLILSLILSGCADDPPASPGSSETDLGTDGSEDLHTDTAEGLTRLEQICEYTNPFSQGPECREYFGDWSEEALLADCTSQQGTLSPGVCGTDELIGTCIITTEGIGDSVLFAYGDAEGCRFAKLGCDVLAKGVWEPTSRCDEEETPVDVNVFIPPELICMDPVRDEAPGNGPNGQVCTWQLISGATEEGRNFEDYASCEVVRTQRPYYAYPRPDDAEKEDTRLQDPEYVQELEWVKSQIKSTACVCCHASSLVPDGVSNWDIDQPNNFMNGFYPSGLALGANWVNSEALGAFPADENNGFDREISGFPSTDPERMREFFLGELRFRGLTQEDFADSPPFGGPLYDQIYFEPSSCQEGSGVASDGTITWNGGSARYIYVLEEGSNSPTIPPNLDKPQGTIWRVDVAPDAEPLNSGAVNYGTIPPGASQAIPEDGTPAALTTGDTYYLYVAADVGLPVTRCLFTAP